MFTNFLVYPSYSTSVTASPKLNNSTTGLQNTKDKMSVFASAPSVFSAPTFSQSPKSSTTTVNNDGTGTKVTAPSYRWAAIPLSFNPWAKRTNDSAVNITPVSSNVASTRPSTVSLAETHSSNSANSSLEIRREDELARPEPIFVPIKPASTRSSTNDRPKTPAGSGPSPLARTLTQAPGKREEMSYGGLEEDLYATEWVSSKERIERRAREEGDAERRGEEGEHCWSSWGSCAGWWYASGTDAGVPWHAYYIF